MAIAVIAFLALIALLWLGLALSPLHRVTFRDLLQADRDALSRDSSTDASDSLPSVTIIAPARNEAAVLPRTVESYCTQAYPGVRVVLVDDQSEDDTPVILENLRQRFANLTVITGEDRPPGWLGKPWAVAQGVRAALEFHAHNGAATRSSGADAGRQWFCFTDSDCVFHPRCVRTAVDFMERRELDMLSLLPHVEFGHWSEIVGMQGLLTVLTLLFPLGLVNNPKRRAAIAAGGFILIRRPAYEKIGGHEAVKANMIEDVSLARLAKSHGCRLHVRLTPDLISTRMYEGWHDLWEGLSKNAYAGINYQPGKFWAGLVVGILVAVLPPVYLLLTLTWWLQRPTSAASMALAATLLMNACMVIVHRRSVRYLKLPAYHALLMPLSTGLYITIAISSAFQHHFRGGNLWKGRRYDRKTLLQSVQPAPVSAQGARRDSSPL